jgi:hypothetical protein
LGGFLRFIIDLKSFRSLKIANGGRKIDQLWYDGHFDAAWRYIDHSNFDLDVKQHIEPLSAILHKFELENIDLDICNPNESATVPDKNYIMNILCEALTH